MTVLFLENLGFASMFSFWGYCFVFGLGFGYVWRLYFELTMQN